MKNCLLILSLSIACAVNSAPAPLPRQQTAAPDSLPTPTRTISTSGNLVSPTSLAGIDPIEPLSTQNTTLPEDEIEFAPGQEDDVEGVILNFENVKEPQPITGSEGGTDPGPRQNEIYRFVRKNSCRMGKSICVKIFASALRLRTSLSGTDGQELEAEGVQRQSAKILTQIPPFSRKFTPDKINGEKRALMFMLHGRFHPDVLAAPPSDTGDMPQLQWPMALSNVQPGSNRAGWSRQQNLAQLPAATDFAGVNMRLEAGAYRELHWHTANEWAYVLNGSVRVEAINPDKQTFIDDLNPGDVWFFPSGVPHYLQGLENGTEFILIFDDGEFSEDSTFEGRGVFQRNPLEVLSKNFNLPTGAFKRFSTDEAFIFNGTVPSNDLSTQEVASPAGSIDDANGTYSYHWSQQVPEEYPGGTAKVLDSRNFPIMGVSPMSTALVTVKPGAMREIHWHGSSDEWNFFISGRARITIYNTPDNSRTFDYGPGDVGYVPKSATHYVENIGDEDVVFIEALKEPTFQDFSVAQMIALLPPQTIKDIFGFTDAEIESLSKDEGVVV